MKRQDSRRKIKKTGEKLSGSILRLVGLEPTRYHYRQILSLVRLPVPPQPQMKLLDYITIKHGGMQAVFFIFADFCRLPERKAFLRGQNSAGRIILLKFRASGNLRRTCPPLLFP